MFCGVCQTEFRASLICSVKCCFTRFTSHRLTFCCSVNHTPILLLETNQILTTPQIHISVFAAMFIKKCCVDWLRDSLFHKGLTLLIQVSQPLYDPLMMTQYMCRHTTCRNHHTETGNNVNSLLEQCTDSSNGSRSHPLYHLTKITKLLQYNIDSLHDPKYLVAPKVLRF